MKLVLGTARFVANHADEQFELLDAAYELGIRAVDTAHVYGDGDSERMIGRWLRARGTASSVTVMTKCCHPYGDEPRVNPDAVAADIDDSLHRLGLDRLALCMLHRDDVTVPISELVDAFAAQIQAGRVEAYGVSNWSTARLREAISYARAAGQPPPVAASSHLSLARPATDIFGCVGLVAEGATSVDLRWYVEASFPLFAWSPLAGGFLSGRTAASEGKVDHYMWSVFDTQPNRDRLRRARQLATERGLDIAQVALAYVLTTAPDVWAVVSTSRPAALNALVRATEVQLSQRDRELLDHGNA